LQNNSKLPSAINNSTKPKNGNMSARNQSASRTKNTENSTVLLPVLQT